MRRKSVGEYPADWEAVAKAVKDAAGWRCVRCDHPHEVETGYVLTVHHLDLDPSNCHWWNLVALCQRCHLKVQAKVVMHRPWMFEHSDWFKPYVGGYYAYHAGYPDDRESVLARLDELAALGRSYALADVAGQGK